MPATTTQTTALDIIREAFTGDLSGTYTRSDGTSFPYSYATLPVADTDLMIGLRHQTLEQLGGMYVERDDDEALPRVTSVEFGIYRRTTDKRGYENPGGYCTVYAPEFRYGDTIRAARVNVSTHSDDESQTLTAFIQMLRLAQRVAEAWTEDRMPALLAAQEAYRIEREESRKRSEAERAEQEARTQQYADRAPEGSRVRLTLKDGTRKTGAVITIEDRKVTLAETSKAHDYFVSLIQKFEVKGPTGRYDIVGS